MNPSWRRNERRSQSFPLRFDQSPGSRGPPFRRRARPLCRRRHARRHAARRDPAVAPSRRAHRVDRRLGGAWGRVRERWAAGPRLVSLRVTRGRISTVRIETFGVVASWDPWRDMLDVWASIQMPKYPDQIARALRIPANSVRVHQDVDVGGSYGVKRGIKQTVLVSHLARRLGAPEPLIGDRLEDMHR